MARGMHRHRKIRLARLAEHKISTRHRKAPHKVKARSGRDGRIIAKIKSSVPANGYSPEVQSWLSRKIGKPFSKLTPAEIAKATA
jgi:hypothetical protein